MTYAGSRPDLPSVMLNNHMDVVAAFPAKNFLTKFFKKNEMIYRTNGNTIHSVLILMQMGSFMDVAPKI